MCLKKKISVFGLPLLIILLCTVLSGCGSRGNDKKDNNDNHDLTVSDNPTEPVTEIIPSSTIEEPVTEIIPSPSAAEPIIEPVTSSPIKEPGEESTPKPSEVLSFVPVTGSEFIKQNYQSYGHSAVYRMPFNDFDNNFVIMAARFAGDNALFWITCTGDDFSEKSLSGEYLILTKPAVSTEQYMIPVDCYFSYIDVLEDGTVIAAEWDTSKVRVYDDKLTLVRSFVPGEGAFENIGFSKDGKIWTVDRENTKIIANDISGEVLYEYLYDSNLRILQYLDESNNKFCFETVTDDENYTHGFMFVSVPNGEITYCVDSDPELGEDLKNQDLLLDGSKIIDSDYTWFLHDIGNAREMVVFPKSEMKEEFCFIQEKKLCTQISDYVEGYGLSQNFRVYDTENITVSECLKNSDIAKDISLYPKGIINDNIVVFGTDEGSKGNAILLWDMSAKASEIKDFCDFSKQDPGQYLSEQLENIKENLGVVITPDKYNESDSPDLLYRIVSGIDFINTFKVGKCSDPEVLVSKSGDYIHPENMRNNDGTKHTFNPHIFSEYYLKEHGEKAKESFFNYVDAVRAGEDRFKCPDPGAVGWVSGRFATYFYPVLNNLTNTEYLGNGWAKIYYFIPKEEILEKISDFEQRICDILNDVIEDDYTDFEKTLALYEFMTEYCTYDYAALNCEDVSFLEQESGYRVLMEKQGICWEISCLYKYLLLQCGVDIEESTGDPVDTGQESHAWNHVVLDGQGYLIDATWGLSDKRKPDLKYFLFTDELRAKRDGFKYESFHIADYQINDMPELYPYDADDDRYQKLWSGTYLAFDQNEKCIFYWDENNVINRFDYD